MNRALDVRLRRTAAVVLAIGWGMTAIAQGPTAKELVFDAVSIKATLPGTKSITWTPYPNRLEFLNLTLDQIIVHAFRVSQVPLTGAAASHGRVLGMPKWATEERFDIVGTTREQHAPAELLDMLRRTLEERFSLKWHTEPKPIPVFALVRMDAERLGPGLAAIDKDCTPDLAARTSPCKYQFRSDGKRIGEMPWSTVFNLIRVAGGAERHVVDRTGLSGSFRVDAEWTLRPNDDSGLPTVFTAVREQMGLRLEPRVEPVEVVVIDSVERPTPN